VIDLLEDLWQAEHRTAVLGCKGLGVPTAGKCNDTGNTAVKHTVEGMFGLVKNRLMPFAHNHPAALHIIGILGSKRSSGIEISNFNETHWSVLLALDKERTVDATNGLPLAIHFDYSPRLSVNRALTDAAHIRCGFLEQPIPAQDQCHDQQCPDDYT
jgi:hypothetical protein